MSRTSHPHILAEVDSERCTDLRYDLAQRQRLCSFDELRVIATVMRRLELGRDRYGYLDLARDARNWKREGAEELVDFLIYRACDELDRAIHRDELAVDREADK